MIHLACTVLAIGDDAQSRALQQKLMECAYSAPFYHTGQDALEAVRRTHPDVVIVGPGLDDMTPEAFVEALRGDPQTASVPVFFLSAPPLAECGDHLVTLGVDDAMEWPADPGAVAQRVRPTVRLSTMRDELATRRKVGQGPQAGLVGETVKADIDLPPSIMVIGPIELADAVEGLFDSAPSLTACADLFEAQRQIEQSRFDACIIATAEDMEPSLDLCLQIRRNPRLFNLPVIIVCSQDQQKNAVRAMNMGASHVMTSPLAAQEARFVLNSLVRRQRIRWAIRKALAETLTPDVTASVIGECYSADFLSGYLTRRISLAQHNHRQLSVVGFAFAGVDAIRHEFGPEAEAHLLNQISQWLTLLVRAEDLVAHLGGARFCVTLPDTPPNEAEVVMQRIAGVISNTDFAVADVYRVVNVWPYVQAFGLTPTDTASTLIETVSTLDASGLNFA